MLTMVEIALHFYHAGLAISWSASSRDTHCLIYPQWDRMHWGLVGLDPKKYRIKQFPRHCADRQGAVGVHEACSRIMQAGRIDRRKRPHENRDALRSHAEA